MPATAAPDARLDQLTALMQQRGIDLLVVTPSSDLLYLEGRRGHASERPFLLVLSPSSLPALVVPALEAAGLPYSEQRRIVTYEETEDPFTVFHEALPALDGSARAAISDQAWASVLLGLQRVLPGTQFEPASSLIGELRRQKDPEEVEELAAAASAADAAFARLIELPFIGRTERQVAADLDRLLLEAGLERADWGPIVGSGPNGAAPHHTVGDRVIRPGDAVVLDFGGVLRGYQADITRTVVAGEPGEEVRRVYEVVRQAQDTGVRTVRPGVTCAEIDAATRAVIHAAGYGDFFIHRTGHGLGLDTHEEPYIVEGNGLALQPGMVFSVEPGVYLPGRFGVRIEDIVAVTDGGARRLNNAERALVSVA